jgi:hypothetical protein
MSAGGCITCFLCLCVLGARGRKQLRHGARVSNMPPALASGLDDEQRRPLFTRYVFCQPGIPCGHGSKDGAIVGLATCPPPSARTHARPRPRPRVQCPQTLCDVRVVVAGGGQTSTHRQPTQNLSMPTSSISLPPFLWELRRLASISQRQLAGAPGASSRPSLVPPPSPLSELPTLGISLDTPPAS